MSFHCSAEATRVLRGGGVLTVNVKMGGAYRDDTTHLLLGADGGITWGRMR